MIVSLERLARLLGDFERSSIGGIKDHRVVV